MSVDRSLGRLSRASRGKKRVIVEIDGRRKVVEADADMTNDQIAAELERQLPKPPAPSFTDNLARSTKNVLGGVAEGALAIPDALWDAGTATQRIINQGLGTAGGAALRGVGLDDAARWWERGAQGTEKSLQQMPRPSTPITRALPPTPGTAGTLARAGGAMLGGALVPVPTPKQRPTFPGPRTAKEVPTIPQLRQQADDLYARAEANGVTAGKTQTKALSDRFQQIAADEGLVSPTGRVSTAYPKAKEALDLAADYAEGTMTPTQMKTVRKVLSDAAGSPDNSERRIAVAMLREFDDWAAPLAPEFAEARAVARRYISAGKIDDAIEAANARVSQFNGSGLENALRTEFRGLDRKILKGKERGFIPEVEQAIRDVSRGTKASNIARNVGKLAPTGVVSAGLSTGVPFAIGTSIGGPAMGGAFSAASTGAGLVGRNAATRLTSRNAELASLIARNGGIPAPSIGMDSLVAPYLARSAAVNSPRAAGLLDEALVARLAAEDERDRKKKKKKR